MLHEAGAVALARIQIAVIATRFKWDAVGECGRKHVAQIRVPARPRVAGRGVFDSFEGVGSHYFGPFPHKERMPDCGSACGAEGWVSVVSDVCDWQEAATGTRDTRETAIRE